MADILLFPQRFERDFKRIEDIIEERIRIYGYDAELAEEIRKTVKDAIQEFGSNFDVKYTFQPVKSSPEEVEAIKSMLHKIGDEYINRLQNMLAEVVRLKIEMCEIRYQ